MPASASRWRSEPPRPLQKNARPALLLYSNAEPAKWSGHTRAMHSWLGEGPTVTSSPKSMDTSGPARTRAVRPWCRLTAWPQVVSVLPSGLTSTPVPTPAPNPRGCQ